MMMIDPALSFEALTHWNTKGRQAGKQTDSDLRDSRHAREDTHTALLEEPRKNHFLHFFFADSRHEGFSENKRRGGKPEQN